ncbi:hypothetical protein Tco_0589276 [Tanacetum coccineum]
MSNEVSSSVVLLQHLEERPEDALVADIGKTTIGGCQFLAVDIFLANKKQTIVATSTTEAKYVAAANCCGQVLWIQNQMYITAKVAGKPVSISKASIRSNLLFDDADGIDSLPNQAKFMLYSSLGFRGFNWGKHFFGKVIPLFASMLVQSTKDEGVTSERPSGPQPTPSPPHPSEATFEPQSDPSPRPSPSTYIPDSILESSGGKPWSPHPV